MIFHHVSTLGHGLIVWANVASRTLGSDFCVYSCSSSKFISTESVILCFAPILRVPCAAIGREHRVAGKSARAWFFFRDIPKNYKMNQTDQNSPLWWSIWYFSPAKCQTQGLCSTFNPNGRISENVSRMQHIFVPIKRHWGSSLSKGTHHSGLVQWPERNRWVNQLLFGQLVASHTGVSRGLGLGDTQWIVRAFSVFCGLRIALQALHGYWYCPNITAYCDILWLL